MKKQAYLIVICDPVTNAVIRVEIWSSPEWEQSICLMERTYVAFICSADSYAEAKKNLFKCIVQPTSRYHWTLSFFGEEFNDDLEEAIIWYDELKTLRS